VPQALLEPARVTNDGYDGWGARLLDGRRCAVRMCHTTRTRRPGSGSVSKRKVAQISVIRPLSVRVGGNPRPAAMKASPTTPSDDEGDCELKSSASVDVVVRAAAPEVDCSLRTRRTPTKVAAAVITAATPVRIPGSV
jgi:hypothetical protein